MPTRKHVLSPVFAVLVRSINTYEEYNINNNDIFNIKSVINIISAYALCLLQNTTLIIITIHIYTYYTSSNLYAHELFSESSVWAGFRTRKCDVAVESPLTGNSKIAENNSR